MRFERTVLTSEKEQVLRERIMAFFRQAGYARVVLQPSLRIERGSLLGSLASSSPRDWLARVTITLPPSGHVPTAAESPASGLQGGQIPPRPVQVRMEVSTSFQWVTRAEQAFFEKELDCLETSITGGVVDCGESEQAFKTAYDASLKANLLILLSAVVGLLLFFLFFRSGAALVLGLALGLSAGQLGAARWVQGRDPVALESGMEAAARLRRELRTWGSVAILLGLVHFLTAGLLYAPWGVVLVLLGLASFFIATPALFVVYAVSLAWAGVSNSLGGLQAYSLTRVLLLVLSLFQLFLALQVFQRFSLYRKVAGQSAPAAAALPIFSAVIGLVSLAGYLALFAAIVSMSRSGAGSDSASLLSFLEGSCANLGVLALASGLAGLVSGGSSRKGLAALGLVTGGFVAVAEAVLILLG
jgi:hypothetical protein